MQVYHFTEQPYPDAWDEFDSLRIDIPNEACDPKVASQILNERLDEWILCDQLGINVMVNEHHATATCLSTAATLTLAILARQTRNVRLLSLGIPIGNRPDPVRVAEEIAYIDVLSRGRLDVGFIKGGPSEIPPSNSAPTRYMDKFWDSHDLILKALSTRDGPFNWESEFTHYKHVNIWPRPYQSPHPPVWCVGLSPGSAGEIGTRGHVLATFLGGLGTAKLHDAYRARAKQAGHRTDVDRFAYMGIVGVGHTREEGLRRADLICGYLRTTGKVSSAYANPPGFMDVDRTVAWLRSSERLRPRNALPATTLDGRVINQARAPMEDLISASIVFAGTPDDVFEQITRFDKGIGGVGNFIMMGHGGHMSHKDAVENLVLFGKEVLPRLQQYGAVRTSAELVG